MSKEIFDILLLNSITTIAISYLYNLFVNTFSKSESSTNQTTQTDVQEQKIDYLYKKIASLEEHINHIDLSIEDIEDKIETKNNKIIESSIALNNKLEDFIQYNYELYD